MTDVFDERWVIEKDTTNILNSGQVWLGPPMGLGVGKQAKITTILNMEGIVNQSPMYYNMNYAAASIGNAASFEVSLNDQKLRTTSVSPISGYIYDDAVNLVSDTFRTSVTPAILNSNLATANLNVSYINSNVNSTGWINYISIHVD